MHGEQAAVLPGKEQVGPGLMGQARIGRLIRYRGKHDPNALLNTLRWETRGCKAKVVMIIPMKHQCRMKKVKRNSTLKAQPNNTPASDTTSSVLTLEY